MISPSVLPCDFSKLGAEVEALDAAGVDLFQWDVMDGQFVPNLTFGPDVIASARKYTSKPFEAHLMVLTPDVLAQRYVDAGCSRLIVHAEACPHLHRTLGNINSMGAKSGIVYAASHTVSGKTAAPSDPTSPSVTGELETLVVEWTNPTDNDFSHVEIRRHSTSTFSSASQIATIKGTTFVDNVGSLQKFYYWIRAVDATGNVSGWTTAASGTSKYLNFKQFPILGGKKDRLQIFPDQSL